MLNDINVKIYDENKTTKIELLEDLKFSLKGKRFTIEAGFVSDGMSVPRILWRFIDPPITAETLVPSIIHDYLYKIKPFSRKEIDDFYVELLKKNDYSKFKIYLIKKGLKWFGDSHWK